MDSNTSPEFCPYKGLQPYEEADESYFFGREHDTEVITSNLCATPLTVVYGASGVGKSSVLLAGVVPALRNDDGVVAVVFREWQSVDFMSRLKSDTLAAVRLKNPGLDLQIDPNLPFEKFLRKCSRASRAKLLFVFDQFEEYFLYHPSSSNGDGDGFESQFARAVNRPDLSANFLLALRDDGLSKLDRFQARIPNMLGNLLRLEHLDKQAAQRAICEPLIQYNEEYSPSLPVSIEGGENYRRGHGFKPTALVERLLDDLKTGKVKLGTAGFGEIANLSEDSSEQIETPFLQMVLTRLWLERNPKTNQLDLQTYDRLNGATNIVRTHLDDVMSKRFSDDDSRDVAARLFQYLVTPDNEKIALSQNVLAKWINEPLERIQPVVSLLSASEVRILRPVDVRSGQKSSWRYEIFHDVLAPAILDWRDRFLKHKAQIEAARLAKAEAERRLAQQRAEAEQRAAEQARLLQSAKAQAEEERQRAEQQENLARAETKRVIAESERAEIERLRAEEHSKSSRRLGYLSKALAAMVLISLGSAIFAVYQGQKASTNERRALASEQEAKTKAQQAKDSEQVALKTAGENLELAKKGNEAEARAKALDVIAKKNLADAHEAKRQASVARAEAKSDRAKAESAQFDAEMARRTASVFRDNAIQAQADARRKSELALEEHRKAEEAKKLNVLYQDALVKYRNKDFPGAIETFNQIYSRMDNDPAGKAYTLNLIGYSYADLQKPAEAVKSYEVALPIYRNIPDQKGEVGTLLNLADAYNLLDGPANRAKAVDYYGQAVKVYQELNDGANVAATKLKLAHLYLESDETQECQKAVEAFEAAVTAFREAKKLEQAADTLAELGEAYSDPFSDGIEKDDESAAKAFQRAASTYVEANVPLRAAETYVKLAGVFESSEEPGSRKKMIEAYEKALSIYHEKEERKEEAKVLATLGGLYGKVQSLPDAETSYNKAAKIYGELGDYRAQASALRSIGRLNNCKTCEGMAKRKALDYYLQVAGIYERISARSPTDTNSLSGAYNIISQIYAALNDKKHAKEFEEKRSALKYRLD